MTTRQRFGKNHPNRILDVQSVSSNENECWCPRVSVVFNVLLSARITAAFLSNISDCDETFNYWEPTHYLMYNNGFQTWEYSPRYALRSYTYVLLHVIPATLVKEVFKANKVTVFYYVRFILAIIAAACETYFFKSIQYRFGNNVARIFFFFSSISTGMFISSAAYLPSSFVMYCCFIAFGGWFMRNYTAAVFGIALGTLLGWPFFALLGLPIAFDMVFRQNQFKKFIFLSAGFFIAIMIPTVAIDSHYYGKQVIAPLNIVLYNVFGGAGPDLYGVESFSFYFINGFLNFNILFIMALISFPFCITVEAFLKTTSKKMFSLPLYMCLLPMYIWMAVFFTRPHKEERFLFPIYPLIIMSGSLTLAYAQIVYQKIFSCKEKLKEASGNWIAIVMFVVFALVSISRTSALYVGYHAPLDIYPELQSLVHPLDAEEIPRFKESDQLTVCAGREWYRYTSSFFLPDRWKFGFIKSDFAGQLPQQYQSGKDGTKVIPLHMNNMNKEEVTAYTDINSCDFLIDIDLQTSSLHEENYSSKLKKWEIITSKEFLVSSKSHPFFRAFYIPFLSSKYSTYTNYNLLHRHKKRRKKI